MALSVNNIAFSIGTNEDLSLKHRIKSSVHNDRRKNCLSLRPKSSPIILNPEGLESFYLSKRNQTAPISVATKPLCNYAVACDRSKNVESEPVSQYRFPSASERISHRTEEKDKVITTQDETASKVYNLGPGYVIYKAGSEFNIRIDSEEFFGNRKKPERILATKKHVEDQKDILIRQLEEQILNLKVYLEEEKLNHNMSVVKWQDELNEIRRNLIDEQIQMIKDLKEEHQTFLAELSKQHEDQRLLERQNAEEKMERAIKELNTYKASFETFRLSLIKETDEKMNFEKKQLTEQHNVEMEEKLDKQKRVLTANFEVDIEKLKEEHAAEVIQIKTKFTSEIETLNKRFADSALLEEKLSKAAQEIMRQKRDYQKLQGEYDDLRQTLSNLRKEMTIVRNDNENLKSELLEFSSRFEERVLRVDDDYKERLDSLQGQIVEMRRAYVAKCEELVEERKHTEAKLHGRIETAKDVMKEIIHTRQRARISLVSLTSELNFDEFISDRRKSEDDISRNIGHVDNPLTSASAPNMFQQQSRPSSAPTTEKDERDVKQKSYLFNKDRL